MGKHIESFKVFEANYQRYSDYADSKWGTPEELKEDALIIVKHMIPVSWDKAEDEIESIKDQSDDKKGIKFEFKLKSGDTLHLFKKGSWRGDWEIYFNRKKVKDKYAVKKILTDRLSPIDQYLQSMKGYDSTWQYADDHRYYSSGRDHQAKLTDLYSQLSDKDKKTAYKEYNKKFKTKTKFKDFTGTGI